VAGKTVVVLGGGVGGVVAATRLRRLLGREHRIVLVDRSPWHTFAPSFISVMLGQRNRARISRDLRLLTRKGIEVVQGEITRIDKEHEELTVMVKIFGRETPVTLGFEGVEKL